VKQTFKTYWTQNKYYQSRYFNWSASPVPYKMLIVNLTSLQIEHKTIPVKMISDTVN